MALFNPFKDLRFTDSVCFLSGLPADTRIPVFPAWLQQRFGLAEKPFKLLNEAMSTFGELSLPCNSEIGHRFIEPLEAAVCAAFAGGYAGIAALEPLLLFQWFSKLLYGLVYAELQIAFAEHDSEAPLGISPSLITRFHNLHTLLQSVNLPFEFEDFQPWSLFLVRVNREELSDTGQFDYRDEMTTMVFSLSFADAGLVMVLHDSGRNELYQRSLLQVMDGHVLNVLQFRELTARVFYSAYLFQPIVHYLVLEPTENSRVYTVSQQPLEGAGMRAVFKPWENRVFAQVLEAVWKPWGLEKKDILSSVSATMTALLDGDGRLMESPALPKFLGQ